MPGNSRRGVAVVQREIVGASRLVSWDYLRPRRTQASASIEAKVRRATVSAVVASAASSFAICPNIGHRGLHVHAWCRCR